MATTPKYPNPIPLNKPSLNGSVLERLRQVIETGNPGGDGGECKAVEQKLCDLFSVRHALLTTSCTHALEMAMMLLDLHPGDEVILPSFTFVSTANAILRGGGRPVFCEINDRTLTLDLEDFQRRITKRTRAVVPVHYAGISAEMDEIMGIARDRGLAVVEDAAQGVNAKYRGRYLGTIGDSGAYSFHVTKNYISGEGGALVTNKEALARRAEIIREKGTNRSNFLRGEVDKYTWVDEGSSYVLSDLLAAVLRSQLEDRELIQSGRKRVHERYMSGLRDLEQRGKLRLPNVPAYCTSNYHIFYILLNSESERTMVMHRLKESGISSAFHYVPLHSSPYARARLGTESLQLPVTDRIYGGLLRLPIYPQLKDAEVDYVVERLGSILRPPA
ncbi:MAG: dTDP-4-amino-4,6-dideoxygalactose transaminase [Ignavibacteria bacterium]|nr:MAG: dTDP-4-amino-4,6-dideoxygalactose transaminase [Ignavibacteria bacterium]